MCQNNLVSDHLFISIMTGSSSQSQSLSRLSAVQVPKSAAADRSRVQDEIVIRAAQRQANDSAGPGRPWHDSSSRRQHASALARGSEVATHHSHNTPKSAAPRGRGARRDRHTSVTASSQRLRWARAPVARLSKPSATRQCARTRF